jgi:hypothetical protein
VRDLQGRRVVEAFAEEADEVRLLERLDDLELLRWGRPRETS